MGWQNAAWRPTHSRAAGAVPWVETPAPLVFCFPVLTHSHLLWIPRLSTQAQLFSALASACPLCISTRRNDVRPWIRDSVLCGQDNSCRAWGQVGLGWWFGLSSRSNAHSALGATGASTPAAPTFPLLSQTPDPFWLSPCNFGSGSTRSASLLTATSRTQRQLTATSRDGRSSPVQAGSWSRRCCSRPRGALLLEALLLEAIPLEAKSTLGPSRKGKKTSSPFLLELLEAARGSTELPGLLP